MRGPARVWYGDMFVGAGTQMPFATMFVYGVFDKFPKLRVVVLESGAGWIGWWLDRADNLYKGTVLGGACRCGNRRRTTSPGSVSSPPIPTNCGWR